jgi:protease-4
VFALFVGTPAVVFWVGIVIMTVGIVTLFSGDDEEYCNVAHIPLHGILTTTSDGFTELLGMGGLVSADDFITNVTTAEHNDDIEAILVDIDSPGGTPVAADEAMTALLVVEKPVVSVIRDVGASAAYWVAAGTDHILASPVSNVGSIGVTMSYLEIASTTDVRGSRWVDLASGAFKDAGHPERPLRPKEEEHFKRQVDSVHEYMVERIAAARPVFTTEEVAALADGRAYVGAEALGLKLVDALGGFAEARTWIAQQLNREEDELVLCAPYRSGWASLFD